MPDSHTLSKSKKRTRILVIEDSRTILSMLSDELGRSGYQVIQAITMEDALSYGGGDKIETVLTDIYLPGADGLTGIRALRSKWPSMQIIAMSAGEAGAGRDDTLLKARIAGADAILMKPFTMEALHQKLAFVNGLKDQEESHGIRVLVIDDSRTIRTLVSRMLTEAGYQVHVAESTEEAIESPDIVGIDLVLTDIFMPGLGGIDGIQIIRRNWPDIRVIAMSGGLDGGMDKGKSLKAAGLIGADATIPKPFTKEALVAVLEGIYATGA